MKTKNLFIITAVLTIVLVAKHETYGYALEPYQIDLGLGAAESYDNTGDITAQDSSHESSNELSSDVVKYSTARQSMNADVKINNTVPYSGTRYDYSISGYWTAFQQRIDNFPNTGNLYSFSSMNDAYEEIINPRATTIPSNIDVAYRLLALLKAGIPQREISEYVHFYKKYNAYLNSIINGCSFSEVVTSQSLFGSPRSVLSEKQYPEIDDKLFEGLAWKLDLSSSIESPNRILLQIEIMNISSSNIEVARLYNQWSFFFLNSIIIRRLDNQELVSLTNKGAHDYYDVVTALPRSKEASLVSLEPGESCVLNDQKFDLFDNYDLAEPGDYEIIFYARKYCDRYGLPVTEQELKCPRKASAQFTILPTNNETASERKRIDGKDLN